MSYDERCVVVTARRIPAQAYPEVWITIYDGPEVNGAALRGVRGPIHPDDLPFHLPDALRDLLDWAHSQWPRMF